MPKRRDHIPVCCYDRSSHGPAECMAGIGSPIEELLPVFERLRSRRSRIRSSQHLDHGVPMPVLAFIQALNLGLRIPLHTTS